MTEPVRVGINGLGRVGRMVVRRLFYDSGIRGGVNLVLANDLEDTKVLLHLLRFDSTQGRLKAVAAEDARIQGLIHLTDGDMHHVSVQLLAIPDLTKLPWAKNKIDVVVEATGRFTKREDLAKHRYSGAQKVILTAPAASGNDVDLTVVMGVNNTQYDPTRHHLISNASCTTNCLAPVAKILHENFGIVRGWMSTVHAFTNDQRLLDLAHKDLRRARAASENFLPASTGAAKAIGLVIPELAGKLDGAAWRVPVPTVSSIDLIVEVEKATTAEEVNAIFKVATWRVPHFAVTDEELVSSDYIGNPYSATVDLKCTKVLGGNLIRVVAWYDNEWAYSCRVVDLIKYIAQRGL